MNTIDLLLLIQMGILLLFPFLRRLESRNSQGQKQHHNFFSAINISLPIAVLVVFFLNRIPSETIVDLYTIDNLTFNIGFMISDYRVIFYSVITISLTIYLNYLAAEKSNKSKSNIDRLSYFAMLLIPFIFSPNFFQLIVVWFVLDVLYLEYIHSLAKINDSENRLGFKQMVFSLFVANVTIIISIVLLLKRAESFSFSSIIFDIQYKFFIHNRYFMILNALFFIGIIAKTSLYPFHSWFRNVNRKNYAWNIPVLSFYVATSIFTLFNTPYFYLLTPLQDVFAWYGIILSFVSVAIAVFMNNENSSFILILSSLSAFILFNIGSNNLSFGFHILCVAVIFATFMSIVIGYKRVPSDSNEEKMTKPYSLSNIVFLFTSAIVMLGLIGIPPLNSSVLSLLSFYELQPNTLSLALFIIGIFYIFLLGITGIKQSYNLWNRRREKIASRNIVLITALILILFLTSLIYPYFRLLNIFGSPT
ncbi:MAG: hypothetical protein KGD64_11255, partial [Candidatus Heimdallarchaeota archaeon]|nr:hypothetical protein [Candidatus Heimdallarchaeota archaeon]